jgi:hypothetical protein
MLNPNSYKLCQQVQAVARAGLRSRNLFDIKKKITDQK